MLDLRHVSVGQTSLYWHSATLVGKNSHCFPFSLKCSIPKHRFTKVDNDHIEYRRQIRLFRINVIHRTRAISGQIPISVQFLISPLSLKLSYPSTVLHHSPHTKTRTLYCKWDIRDTSSSSSNDANCFIKMT